MPTVKTLKPGQRGSKELLTRFGPSLLWVRCRYDEDSREHLKTVELIVQRRSGERAPECLGSGTPGARSGGVATRQVALRIGWRERDLAAAMKSAGGRWDPARRVWILRRDVADNNPVEIEREDCDAQTLTRGTQDKYTLEFVLASPGGDDLAMQPRDGRTAG